MVVFWRRGINALERKPDADSATQQDMGVAATTVQDPISGDQIEANLDSIGELAPDDAATESTLDPNLTDPTAPGPTLDMGLVVQIQQNMRLVVAINRNPDIASALAQDPTQLAQIEQNLGLAEQRFMEPGGVAGPAAVAGLDVVEPGIPEPGPPDQDLDAQPNP
jgi:hypothetical protein